MKRADGAHDCEMMGLIGGNLTYFFVDFRYTVKLWCVLVSNSW